MEPAVSVRDAGIRFTVPRRGSHRKRRAPRLFRRSRWELWGLRNVTLDVAHGEVLGVVGANGSGKTTLLRTISGIYRPDEGIVAIRGTVSPVLSLTGGLELPLSGWENVQLSAVLLGLTHRRAQAITAQVAEFAGLERFMDAPVRVYSQGMRARLGFAVALFTDPDILVLDEVMEVGDEDFRARSREKIQEIIDQDRTVVVASHEVESAAALCDRMVRLEQGRIVDEGEPDRVAASYLASAHERERQPARNR